MRKILVAGWFSFENCGVTAGDIMAKDVACQWLETAGYEYDVALVPPFVGGVDWRSVEANNYSHTVFVCGPFLYANLSIEFLKKFDACHLIGLDLSMFDPINIWNPFDTLLERDSSVCSRPDISLLSQQAKVPVVGVILVEPQYEYQNKDKYQLANAAVERLIASRDMVAVPIDTRLFPNTANLRNAAEVESLIARMDFVITTRLHGTVLAIKNGVPPIVIDGISGGAKVSRQAKTLGWDIVFSVDNLNDEELERAFNYCQTEEARLKARECCNRAINAVEEIGDKFIKALDLEGSSSRRIWNEEAMNKSFLEPMNANRVTIRGLVVNKVRIFKNKTMTTLRVALGKK